MIVYLCIVTMLHMQQWKHASSRSEVSTCSSVQLHAIIGYAQLLAACPYGVAPARATRGVVDLGVLPLAVAVPRAL